MKIDLLTDQEAKRQQYLDKILQSSSPRKLIIAGPGTGKTHTFSEILKQTAQQDHLAITLTNRLVSDMQGKLGDDAETKTFHAFCKRLLHEINGRVELAPYLTKVITKDATFLGYHFHSFDARFQTLDEQSVEVKFYLARGDYYEAVSFNDSVYRLYRHIRDGSFELPRFAQIVVDEYQDFNPLEVALIGELERASPILIVGDDDQAVYAGRNSSPCHLRERYGSGRYEIFELPFCTRCPPVIVTAADAFVHRAIELGAFPSRIERPFVPYLPGKEYESTAYPKIITAEMASVQALKKFVTSQVGKIPARDIESSYAEKHPTVMIVGQTQYLNPLKKELAAQFHDVTLARAPDFPYSYLQAYRLLRTLPDSNLGWRILAGLEYSDDQMTGLLRRTIDGTPMVQLLPPELVAKHQAIIQIIRTKSTDPADMDKVRQVTGVEFDDVVSSLFMDDHPPEPEIDQTKPSILLTTFEGCKGLSAGHVFMVGLNQGEMPKPQADATIPDIEYSKFVVALTRTRKLCYLLPVLNRFGERFKPSTFVQLIPDSCLDRTGYHTAADIHDH